MRFNLLHYIDLKNKIPCMCIFQMIEEWALNIGLAPNGGSAYLIVLCLGWTLI